MAIQEPQERHYNINKLNRLFAIASIILLVVLGMMFKEDVSREWKNYQRQFRDLEVEKTRIKLDLTDNQLQKNPDFKTLEEALAAARKEYNSKCATMTNVQKTVERLKTENDIISQRYRVRKAELDAARFAYEDAREKKSGVEKAHRHFSDLEKQVLELKLTIEKNTQETQVQNQVLTQCGQKFTELQKKEYDLSATKTILERKLKKIDPAQMSLGNIFADMVRDSPVIDFANPNFKIQQVVLRDLKDDVNFLQVPKVDRCMTCHLGITNPDYQDAPQPFRTHPNLELYLGKNSPHSLDEFGCTVCHGGRGRGTDFTSTAHTPSSETQAEEWKKKYNWHELHHWDTPMYPKQYVEAGCFKCHSDSTAIKGAEKLNLGLMLIERSGCYACHLIGHYKDWPKPGPDLTHIASKLDKKWAYRWIDEPRDFRKDTSMPSFFHQSNTSDPESLKRSQQEIHAIVEYLFAKSQPFELQPVKESGDAKSGEEIVASIGCFGCHNLGEEAQKRDPHKARTREELLRHQGPNLVALGSKVGKEWLFNWLKDPHRYHPETRMPNLRLSDKEAADIAAYLTQDQNLQFSTKTIPAIDENEINTITVDFLRKGMTQAQADQKLKEMLIKDKLTFSGEKLIAQYGCFSCHNIAGFENFKPIGTELTEEGNKSIHNLDFGFIEIPETNYAWFHQKLKDPRIFDTGKIKAPDEKLRMPNFHFSDEEIEAVTTAIMGFVNDRLVAEKKPKPTAERAYMAEGQKIIRQFNCQGCHIIEGEGGAIRPKIAEWLVKYQGRADNEAQAMIGSFSPPNLVGEGKKVQSEWLFHFLHEPTTVRPWLKPHMPTYTFNAAHLNALVKYFNAVDKQDFPFVADAESTTPQELEAGKKLFSNDYFGCAQCHIVGDKMPSGSAESWAPNFALAKTRLKPEWIKEWIKNPAALLPGTKMPTFFDPANFNESGPPDVLDGDENRQIKAVRDYLLTIANQGHEPQPTETPQPAPAASNGAAVDADKTTESTLNSVQPTSAQPTNSVAPDEK